MKLMFLPAIALITIAPLEKAIATDDNTSLIKEFGPKYLRGQHRRSTTHKINFQAEKPNADYILRLTNGDGRAFQAKSCKQRRWWSRYRCRLKNRYRRWIERLTNIRSVRITNNGQKIYSNSRFHKMQTSIDIPFDAEELNKLKFKVRGYFYFTRMKVEIYRLDSPNIAPIAAFTSSSQGELSISFDASASSDEDGEIVEYNWDLGDGNTATGENIQHIYSEHGDYSITLTVVDDAGDSDQFTEVITVENPNSLPIGEIFYAHENIALPTVMLFEAQNLSDPDGEIVDLLWDFGDGNTSTEEVAFNVYFTAGTYTVTLTLTDDLGGETVITENVVIDNNNIPVADFSFTPQGAQAPATISFDASNSSDPDDHEIIEHIWKVSDGRQFNGENVDIPFTDAGEYNIELTILDELHGLSRKNKSVIITTTEAPVIVLEINNDDPTAPAVFEFDASGSFDPDGSIVDYQWVFGDGNTGSGAIVEHTYQFPGSVIVELRVTDADGDMAIHQFNLQID